MKILCVDRSWLNRLNPKRIIQRVVPEAEIHRCKWPKDAVALAKTEGCDVLVTEMNFGISRWIDLRFAEEIKKINPRVNIIFVTDVPEWKLAREILQLRISGYITKPYEANALEEEFQNLRYETV